MENSYLWALVLSQTTDRDIINKLNIETLMKKIFTLIAMAFAAMSVNAQTESYLAIDEDGNLASEFTNAQWEGTDLVATIQTAHVTVKGISSKTPKDIEDQTDATLSWTKDTWPADCWADASWSQANKNKNIWYYDTDGTTQIHVFQFRSVWGKGNPVTGFVSEPVMTDGVFAGKYRPNYDGCYFVPGTSTTVPVSGEYFEFTADVDGMFKIGFYTPNGANRYMYIVEKATVRTLSLSEFKVEGYVNGCDNLDGSPMYLSSIKVNEDYSIGDADFNESYKDGAITNVNQLNQQKYGWFVFNAKAGTTYMIFGPNYQFGFRGFDFTPGAKIEDYTPTNPTAINAIKTKANSTNTPAYNVAGQRVNTSYKGLVIKGGVKSLQK